jgi:hypothetical protein
VEKAYEIRRWKMMLTISEDKIRVMIKMASRNDIELVWIPRIMECQTDEEYTSGVTSEDNNVGLNAFDSKPITNYYKRILAGKHLNQEQISDARNRLEKYAKQYASMIRKC